MKLDKIRTYHELNQLKTFEDRYNYLKLNGKVGEDKFGYDRIFNQKFYHSREWKNIRNFVITRDMGCDLGISDREIMSSIMIHHMNPIDMDDIKLSTNYLLDPNFLICCSDNTHKAIHYGDKSLLIPDFEMRSPGDTTLW